MRVISWAGGGKGEAKAGGKGRDVSEKNYTVKKKSVLRCLTLDKERKKKKVCNTNLFPSVLIR